LPEILQPTGRRLVRSGGSKAKLYRRHGVQPLLGDGAERSEAKSSNSGDNRRPVGPEARSVAERFRPNYPKCATIRCVSILVLMEFKCKVRIRSSYNELGKNAFTNHHQESAHRVRTNSSKKTVSKTQARP